MKESQEITNAIAKNSLKSEGPVPPACLRPGKYWVYKFAEDTRYLAWVDVASVSPGRTPFVRYATPTGGSFGVDQMVRERHLEEFREGVHQKKVVIITDNQ